MSWVGVPRLECLFRTRALTPRTDPQCHAPPRGVESDSLRLSALKLYLHRVRFCIGVLKRQDNPGIQTCDVLLLQRGREGV